MRNSWLYFGHAVGAAQRTGLDLSAVGGNGNVCNGGVLGFAGTVRSHCGITVAVCHFDSIQRFTE